MASGPPLVLVVDDYEDSRRMFEELLSRHGFRAESAGTAREALERARADHPDAIVMDLSMPDVDGYEATRRLKADPATAAIPVIALTAHAAVHSRRAAAEAGCEGYVEKPCTPTALTTEIVRHLPPEAAARVTR